MVHMGKHSHLPLVPPTPVLREHTDPGRAKCRRLPLVGGSSQGPHLTGSHEAQTTPMSPPPHSIWCNLLEVTGNSMKGVTKGGPTR